MKRACRTGVAGVIVMVAGTATGAEVGTPESRVRTASPEARTLVLTAAMQSPTVAALIAEIDASDVIVVIELRRLPKRLNGLVQVAAATGTTRYLRLALNVPNGRVELATLLGHELRHAVEITRMPSVRDDVSLAAAYRGAGASTLRGGYFETKAALETGRAVAREVKARRCSSDQANLITVQRSAQR